MLTLICAKTAPSKITKKTNILTWGVVARAVLKPNKTQIGDSAKKEGLIVFITPCNDIRLTQFIIT